MEIWHIPVVFFAGILALYLTFFQFLFIYTLYNQEENAFPYIGIIFVIFIGLAHHLSSYLSFEKLPYKKFVKYMVAGLLAPCVFYLCLRGVEVALLRRVQDISPLFFSRGDAKLIELKDQNLKPLKWINPTMVSGVPISDVEFQELYTYLYREDKNFFIFPDFTAFYGLTQKPSPQPLLWFDRELTYDYRNCAYLDEWIVRDLKRHKVQIVVIEKISWLNTEERLNDFPKLKSFIFDNFIASQEIGIFQIFVSRRDRKN